MMLLITSTLYASESNTQIILKSDDGRYYLTEQSVIDLANYLKKLEDLNANYSEQITNLKKQIDNLSLQINELEKQISVLEQEKRDLEKALENEKNKKLTWTVVAVLTIGTTIYFFVK